LAMGGRSWPWGVVGGLEGGRWPWTFAGSLSGSHVHVGRRWPWGVAAGLGRSRVASEISCGLGRWEVALGGGACVATGCCGWLTGFVGGLQGLQATSAGQGLSLLAAGEFGGWPLGSRVASGVTGGLGVYGWPRGSRVASGVTGGLHGSRVAARGHRFSQGVESGFRRSRVASG
jgi:hypothetical protein